MNATKESATAATQEAEPKAAAATTTIAGADVAVSASGSCRDTTLAEHKRYHTGGQRSNSNNNNTNSPGNSWRPTTKSTKYNAKPWQYGRRPNSFQNSWNNCNPNFYNNNNKNNNRQFSHSHRSNSESFIERLARQNPTSYTYQQEPRRSTRDHQDRNRNRCASSLGTTSRAEARRDERRERKIREEKEKQRETRKEAEDQAGCSKKSNKNPKETKEQEGENRIKTKATVQEVDGRFDSKRSPTSRSTSTAQFSHTPPKSLEEERRRGKLPVKETEAASNLPPGNPQIKVRPFEELLKQEIIAVTQEQRATSSSSCSSSAPSNGIARSATRFRRSTVTGSSHGSDTTSITERLASMDKESLKYIINNSDTIYNDHLKQQARRRLREEIRRQLKEIELEQPKDKPATDLVEDEIVDAIKLPQILLQEIEKCFGLELAGKEQEQGQQDQQEERQQEQEKQQQPEQQEEQLVQLQVKQELQEEQQDQQEQRQQEQKEQQQKEQPEQQEEQPEQQEEQLVQLQVKQEQLDEQQEQQEELQQEQPEQQEEQLQVKQELVEQEEEEQEQEEEQQQQEEELQQQPIPSSDVEEQQPQQDPKAKESCTDEQNKAMEAEESFKNGKLTSLTQKQSVETRKRNLQRRRNEQQLAVKSEPELECIKKENNKESNESSIAYIVLSSSEDEDDVIEVQEQKQEEQDQEESDDSCSQRRYQLRLQADAKNVVDSFEKLIVPQLKESLAESYRSSHCSSLQSRLLFISCVVTSEHNTQQTFSKTEVAKMQQNLKSADNRLGIEFLLRQIVQVVNHFKQAARQKQQAERQREREQEKATGPNELNLAQSAEPAEASVEAHQSEAAAARASLPPTPPRNGTPTNMRIGLSTLSSLGLPYLPLDAAAAAALPRLSPSDSIESLLVSGNSVTHNLHEIDRRLLENQNRRKFLEEMIMKFQKEKSDMEMLSLELQNIKFLLLNAVIGRNQVAAAAAASPSMANTPTNSPPPPPASEIAAAEVPRRQPKRKVRRTRILPRRKAARTRSQRGKLPSESAESKSSQTDDALATCTSSCISLPQPIKEEPDREAKPPNKRTANAAAAATDSAASTCGKRQRLAKTAAQQPLAVIPPLPPPPPPPEPIANMSPSYELPRIPRKPTTPPPAVATPGTDSFNYGFIPSGRLHSITSPITQIRVHKVSIIAASENGDIYVYNIGSHKLEQQIPKHSEAITNMYLCDRDAYLYTTSLDGFLKKSSLENLERVMQTVYLKEPLQSIDIAWGIAFIGSRWGNLFTYNIAANKVMDMPLLKAGQSIIAIKATKEGARKIIMLGCKGNFVLLHDAATGLLLRRLSVPEGLNVYSLLLDDSHVFCGTQKNEVFKFEFSSGALNCTLSCGNGAVAMATYRDRYLLIGCYDGFIYVLNKENGIQLGRFSGPGRLVLALAIVGDKIVTSSKDNSMEVLEIPPEILSLDN